MAETDASPVPDYMKGLRLDGRGVIVFGAGQGIGRQAAHAVSQAGAEVICVDLLHEAAQRVAAEVGGAAIACDVTERSAVERCLDEATRLLPGRISGIIDIVGEARLTTLANATDALWQSQFDIVTRHAFLVTQLGSAVLERQGGGAISFVGSISGRRMLSRQSIYGAAKAALHHLVRCAAVELASQNIRVNAVAPGLVHTPRLDRMVSDAKWKEIEATIPAGKAATPAEIAQVLLFLTSDLASYVTGQVIGMDGGLGAATPLPAFV